MRGNIVQRDPANQTLKFANEIGIDLNLLGITRQGRSGGFDGRQRFTKGTWPVETLRYWSYEQLTRDEQSRLIDYVSDTRHHSSKESAHCHLVSHSGERLRIPFRADAVTASARTKERGRTITPSLSKLPRASAFPHAVTFRQSF